MNGLPFITRPMSLLLDAIRGLAAVVVLVGHGVQMEIYTGPFPFDQRLQHNAVVVFFVLSGLVIAHSARHSSADLRSYAIARIARIMPVAVFAILLSVGLFTFARMQGLDAGMPAPYDRLGWSTTLAPALFLSQSIPDAGLVWNPPFWSLCYEIWYYALFAAAFYLRGRRRLLCLALFALIAGWQVLLLLPVWLMGAFVARNGGWLHLSRWKGLAALLAGFGLVMAAHRLHGPVAVWLLDATGLSMEDMGYSVYFVTDGLMGLGIGLAFVGLRPLAQLGAGLLGSLARPIDLLAGFSFTLYLVHWPLLALLRGYGIGAGDNLPVFVAIVALVIAFSAFAAIFVERPSKAFRGYIERQTRRSGKGGGQEKRAPKPAPFLNKS